MPKPKVLATHSLFEPARQILQKTASGNWAKPGRPPREEVFAAREGTKRADLSAMTEKIQRGTAERGRRTAHWPRMWRWDLDNIDVAACRSAAWRRRNTPGVLDETTADFAWTLLMAVARRLSEGEALARSGNWKNWDLDQW